VFDALNKVSMITISDPTHADPLQLHCDPDTPVRDGAGLVDRLLKDIVAENAADYISVLAEDEVSRPPSPRLHMRDVNFEGDTATSSITPIKGAVEGAAPTDKGPSLATEADDRQGNKDGHHRNDASPSIRSQAQQDGSPVLMTGTKANQRGPNGYGTLFSPLNRAFSVSRFIPLLAERIFALHHDTRSHLVSWVSVLDSIPELEMVSWLPDYFDGLLWVLPCVVSQRASLIIRNYLTDPNEDLKLQTENVLASFLEEIKHIAEVQRRSMLRRAEHGQDIRDRQARRSKRFERGIDGNGAIESDDEDGNKQSPPLSYSGRVPELMDDARSWSDDDVESLSDDDGRPIEPGENIQVNHEAILDVIIHNMSRPSEFVRIVSRHRLTRTRRRSSRTISSMGPDTSRCSSRCGRTGHPSHPSRYVHIVIV
jgi:vacuole morphology and inheritance protein 14